MITFINGGPVLLVGYGAVELGFTNAGTYVLPDGATRVSGISSNFVDLTVRSGAVVTVDSAGAVRVVDGPDLLGAGVYGFAVGVSVIGLVLFIRWATRAFMGAARIHVSSE